MLNKQVNPWSMHMITVNIRRCSVYSEQIKDLVLLTT